MLRTVRWIATLLVVVACNGGSAKDGSNAEGDADADADSDADSDADTDTDTEPVLPRVTPTHGTGLALTADGAVAVVANRSVGEVTVMDLDLGVKPATGAIRVTFDEGDAEPWAAVLSTDESAAFVILREGREVMRIDDPRGAATLHATRAPTDSEPSGLAISPNGTTLYVANWGAGNVTVVDTETMATHTVDLNQALVDTGTLGPAVLSGRPGLAHPYAIVVTDDGDGDDTDETVWVTEFFSQADPAAVFTDDSYFDTSRQGFVYSFDAATETVAAPVALGASADMGFVDSTGETAGCFPNQLYAAALDGTRLYVAGICTSPRGGIGAVDITDTFRSRLAAALYVVDTTAGAELVAERLMLNAVLRDFYDATGEPDTGERRYPLIVNSLAFEPGTHALYLSSYGADALFRIEFDDAGALDDVGFAFRDYVNLMMEPTVARLPFGVAVTDGGNAVVVAEHSRNLAIVDFTEEWVESVIPSATPVPAEEIDANNGHLFFAMGLGRYSLGGQAWVSCEGCHPHGRTDNVTWFLSTGPRQTPSLDGVFAADGTQRMLNWNPYFDEMADFEGFTRNLSGGVGSLVWDLTNLIINDDRIVIDGTPITGNQIATDRPQSGLNGTSRGVITVGVPGHDVSFAPVTARALLNDWNKMEAWIETIRAPHRPELDPAAVADGEALFVSAGCAGCHGGPSFTISERFYVPSAATNDAISGSLSTDTYSRGTLPVGLNPPADAGGGTAVLRANGTLQCVLRSVGTFPVTGNVGVAPSGVVVSERAENMVSPAAGIQGFNPPALVGVGASAPYFHAGNARALEEIFDPVFDRHTRALSLFSPTAAQIDDLVAYLLSIDDESATLSTDFGAVDTVICP